MYSGGVEPRPYGVVGVGLCSVMVGRKECLSFSLFKHINNVMKKELQECYDLSTRK